MTKTTPIYLTVHSDHQDVTSRLYEKEFMSLRMLPGQGLSPSENGLARFEFTSLGQRHLHNLDTLMTLGVAFDVYIPPSQGDSACTEWLRFTQHGRPIRQVAAHHDSAPLLPGWQDQVSLGGLYRLRGNRSDVIKPIQTQLSMSSNAVSEANPVAQPEYRLAAVDSQELLAGLRELWVNGRLQPGEITNDDCHWLAASTAMLSAESVATCPNCYSESLEFHHYSTDKHGLHQLVTCVDCDAAWHDRYMLSEQHILEEGRPF